MAPFSRPRIETDPVATQERLAMLDAYMSEHVLGQGGFRCSAEASCRDSIGAGLEFAAGQLSYVGRHYDLAVDGMPFRILVVGMDTGRPDEHVSLSDRRKQIQTRIDQSFTRRNPHMRGTSLALRVLLGRDELSDEEADEVQTTNGPLHILHAYAMANVRLCSAHPPASTTSKGTPTMTANCLRHLSATIGVLEPQVVVLQGARIRPSLAPIVSTTKRLTAVLEEATMAGVPLLLASFSHPSYPGPRANWSWPSAPYFGEVVQPALRQARTTLLV